MPNLYPEDQQRVAEYLSASEHQVKRKPFAPLKLLAGIAVILTILTAISVWVAQNHGTI